MKNEDTIYRTLAATDFPWKDGEEYVLTLRAIGATLSVLDASGNMLVSYTDNDHPYLNGAIGVGVEKGHCAYRSLRVKGI